MSRFHKYFAQCHYAECRWAECRYAESRGTPTSLWSVPQSYLQYNTDATVQRVEMVVQQNRINRIRQQDILQLLAWNNERGDASLPESKAGLSDFCILGDNLKVVKLFQL